jgi:hypothetical protein
MSDRPVALGLNYETPLSPNTSGRTPGFQTLITSRSVLAVVRDGLQLQETAETFGVSRQSGLSLH